MSVELLIEITLSSMDPVPIPVAHDIFYPSCNTLSAHNAYQPTSWDSRLPRALGQAIFDGGRLLSQVFTACGNSRAHVTLGNMYHLHRLAFPWKSIGLDKHTCLGKTHLNAH